MIPMLTEMIYFIIFLIIVFHLDYVWLTTYSQEFRNFLFFFKSAHIIKNPCALLPLIKEIFKSFANIKPRLKNKSSHHKPMCLLRNIL